MRACSACRSSAADPSVWRRIAGADAPRDDCGPRRGLEVAGQRRSVVMPLHPFQEGDALGLPLVPVALEEGVEDARLSIAVMAVSEGQLFHGLGGRAPLQQNVESGEEAGPVGPGFAMSDGRVFEAGEKVLGAQDGVAIRS